MPRFWYRKLFDLPKHWEGSRILLNFGAVDWQCQVFVNGQEMGTHTGGYDKVTLSHQIILNFPAGALREIIAFTCWNIKLTSVLYSRTSDSRYIRFSDRFI